MINIVIPMAGRGQRFLDKGYTTPKPLLMLDGKPMIKHVIDTMEVPGSRFVFLIRKDHCKEYNLDKKLKEIKPDAEIVIVDKITEGAICTVLLAQKFFNNDDSVIIKDCDQIINWNPEHFFEFVQRNKVDGSIITINTDNPGYSFAKVNNRGHITQTAEKSVISNSGSVGIYYFGKGKDLINYANMMIDKNIRVNNEFYVAPVYNEAIGDGLKIKTYDIEKMWGIGTPEDLNYFLENYENI